MTVGKLYAQARLKHARIYCINNKVINVSGSVNCACFDKVRKRYVDKCIDRQRDGDRERGRGRWEKEKWIMS